MKQFSVYLIAAILLSSPKLHAQTSKRLLGTWISYNRADTMTILFTNDSTMYFHLKSAPEFNDSVFKYWPYKIETQGVIQYMLLVTPPSSSDDLKYYLWFVSANEIRLQGVLPRDSDNPTAHIPPETTENTLRLKRL